jgi:hypothetical protein
MTKKNTRGGKRRGAGRKLDPNKKRPATFKLSVPIIDYLATTENKTATIELAVQRSKGFKEWQRTRTC